ncbi:lipid A export permease/ATP-binding protein MsbA [Polaromonas sp.]|uniref:lipid A export permease/ATP-binding protein MsbA n=1 Tax=Polaromonas sp. TaxID=1869339 RepID=UPI003521EE38
MINQRPGVPEKSSLLRRISRVWPYFSGSRTGWALAIGATIAASAAEPFIPALLKPLLDRGFQQDSFSLWLVPFALMLLFTLRGLSGFLAQFALAKVTNDGLLKLRKAMFGKLLTARPNLFVDQSSSAIANTVVYEVFNGSSLLINAIMKLARDLLTLLALIGYLVYLNWKLTLIVALLFPAVGFVIQVLSKRLYRLTKESQSATDNLAYVVEENVMAYRDVRLHDAQASQADRFDVLSNSLRRLSMKSTAAYAGMSAITQVLAAVALSAVISIALLQSTESTTTVGGFVAFVTAMLLLIAPIKSLSDAATPVTRGLAALERGLDLMDLTQDEMGGAYEKPRAAGNIEFSNVSVLYKTDAVPAINRFSLSIKAGETIAIVGPSGSGKTTLVNLLPRFMDISSGQVLLDGVDIREWNIHALRQQIAYVNQNVVMLNATIATNVALGHLVDRTRVAKALEAANLSDYLSNLPEGMDTMVGHNATQLSGGQRQRLAIARAVYKNAPILILDEATSALDSASEQAVKTALQRLMHGRTTLIVAHRLSTIEHADKIVVMEKGRFLEVGNHQELTSRPGPYSRMLQSANNSGNDSLDTESSSST